MTKVSSPTRWNKHQLEGDGNIRKLFHYLWKKNKHLESCPGVMIPDTIVYEHNFPIAWYYFADNELRKKSGRELETRAIFNHFIKNVDESHGIVAQFLSTQEDVETGEVVNKVEFLTVEDLQDFLFKRKQRDFGLLQKFITPKGSHNSQIEAIWSPHVTLLERRVNIHRLSDKKNFSPYERAVTWEGPSHYSNEVFCAPNLQAQIKQICQNIVNHFAEIEHKKITRMVLYFKVAHDGVLWLLWSSSIRIASGSSSSSVKEKGIPLNLSPKFRFDQCQQGSIDMRDLQELIDKTEERMTPTKKKRTPSREQFKNTVNANNEVTHLELPDNVKKEKSAPGSPTEKDNIDDLDENAKKEYLQLEEVLDELLYEAYSHFLHSREPFYFNMPKQLKDVVAEKLEELLGKLKIQKDESSDMYYIPDQKVSIGMLQSEFAEFKKYCLECFYRLKRSARD